MSLSGCFAIISGLVAPDTFKIGENRMPAHLIREIGVLKKTAVLVNRDPAKLPKEKANLIIAVADEVIAGKLHK